MIRLIFFVESIGLAAWISVLIPLTSPAQFWIPLLITICSYVLLNLLYLVYLVVISKIIDMSKTYDTQSKFYYLTMILTMKWLIGLAHVIVKTSGLEKLPKDKKYVLVYNHTSNFDPIVQSYVLRKDNLIHLSKPGNFKIPMAGPVVHRCCFIPVDRENDRNAIMSIMRAAKYLKENKFCVGISPEGTRNKGNPKELLPFRDGCFKAAQWGEADICICVMKGVENIKRNFFYRLTVVHMDIVDVLKYDNVKNMNTHDISAYVREKMMRKINEGEN